MKITRPEQKRVRIEILPMIDVMFLILVFFVYSMFSMAIHRGVLVRLPVSSQVESQKVKEISVSIDKNGNVYVDKTNVGVHNLASFLMDNYKSKDLVVLLFGDKEVSYQHIFEVLDKIKEAGFSKISLQAKKE
ncbi:MAG: ExbD/TolR family protein [Desulfatiglandales bacterium]